GEIVWNQSRKRDRWEGQHQQARPAANGCVCPRLTFASCRIRSGRRPIGRWPIARQVRARESSDPRIALPLVSCCQVRGVRGGPPLASALAWGAPRQVLCVYVPMEARHRGMQQRFVRRMEIIAQEVLATLQDDILLPV